MPSSPCLVDINNCHTYVAVVVDYVLLKCNTQEKEKPQNQSAAFQGIYSPLLLLQEIEYARSTTGNDFMGKFFVQGFDKAVKPAGVGNDLKK